MLVAVKTRAPVEECWTLVGEYHSDGSWRGRRLRLRTGQPTTVTADAQWTLAREEIRGDVIGFWHTHPMGGVRPSRRDIRTMRAWCDAFGKPLICVIESPSKIAAWRFEDYRSRGAHIATVQMIGKTQLIGSDNNGRKISSRRDLPRRRSAGTPRRAARHSLRRRRNRIQSG